MQSDERTTTALSALGPRIAAFRLAISSTLERATNALASESGPSQAGVTLGDFASGRIDAERFAMISAGSPPLDRAGRTVVKMAVTVLELLLRGLDDELVLTVESGESLATAIRERMETLGRVYRAATLIELVRRGTYDAVQHGPPSEGYAFEKWTIAERRLAPPLVVRLDGRDLDAFALAPFVDGWVRLILIVDGQCSPAPLARLVSPGVFVAQSGDTKVMDRLTEFDGPAVIAVMNGTEARFVHDPRAGSAIWQRIEITHMPDALPRKSVGTRSAWQQRDDLSHLKALIERPALPADSAAALVASVGGNHSDPAERLTAWLLEQTSGAGVA